MPHSRALVAVGTEPTEAERAEVTALVARYRSRTDTFDLSLLENYVEAHPDSPYAPSLHFAIGLAAREMARYQDTLSHLHTAWRGFEGARSTLAREQADAAVAELAVMHAQLGHRETLRSMFTSLRTRPPLGVSAERMNHAWEGYQAMEVDPGRAYLCGPLSLRSVWRATHDNRVDADPRLNAFRSTHQGTNVAQLAALAADVGMNLRAARHPVGAPWASPMVVHWKVGHFAAILEQRDLGGGRALYLLRDPTFGEDRWTTGEILDREASGVVLASASDERTAAWAPIPDAEAQTTWGRGYTTGGDPNKWGEEYRMKMCSAGNSKKMARRYLITHLATLAVEDTPIWNNPAYGDPLEFRLSYNQADWEGPGPGLSHIGSRWTHNWRGEMQITPTASPPRAAAGNVSPAAYTPGLSLPSTSIVVRPRTGGHRYYRVDYVGPGQAVPEVIDYATGERLVFTHDSSNNVTSAERRFLDHSTETYTAVTPGYLLLTQVTDTYGRVTTLTYGSSSRRLESVSNASGTMVFHYDTTDPEAETFLLVRSVSIGDREALFDYTRVPGEPTGDGGVGPEGPHLLRSSTDMGGLVSSFEYGSAARGLDPHEVEHPSVTTSIPDPTFLRFMTTPYGQTEFRTGWGLAGSEGISPPREIHRRRWLDVIYPGGERERIARQDINEGVCTNSALCFVPESVTLPPTMSDDLWGMPGTVLTAYFMNSRNTFYWSPEAFRRARARNPSGTGEPEDWDLDIHDAHNYHWMHAPYDVGRATSILESEQEAGELRVFYRYKGQTDTVRLDQNNYGQPATPSALVAGIYRHVSNTGTSDQQDRTTRMTYNAQRRLESVTDDEGQKLVYSYNTAGDVTQVARDVGGGTLELVAELTYGTAHPHLPLTMRDSTNQVTSFAYNANHQVTTVTLPNATTIVHAYDPTTARETSVSSVAGTSTTTYNARGLPETVTDHEGITRTIAYDDLDRVLTITAPGSRTVTYDYRYRDANGALALDSNGDPFEGLEATSVTGVDGNTSISSYDALHRLRYSTTSGADPTYYAYGVVDSGWFHRLEMRRASGGSTVPTTQWSFAMGTGYSTRPTRLRRTAGGTHEDTTYAFNAAGELTSVTVPDAAVTTFGYDEVGRTTTACHDSMCTDGAGYTYDVLRDRLTHSTSAHGGVSVERTLSYGPSAVVGTTLPTTTLPNADRVVEAVEETYAGTTLMDTDTAAFAYDVLGRAASVTHDGETLTHQYDTAGRFTGMVNNATTPPTPVVGYQYGSTATPRRPSLETLPRTNCVRDFLYQSQSDDLRMYSSWLFNDSTWQRQAALDLTYKTDGRLNSEQDESVWRYFYYNAARRLGFHSEYVNNGSGTYNLESGNDASYDAWGNTTSISRYQDWGSGWSWSLLEGRTFSLSDRLLTRAMGASGTPTHTLTYDARGRVTGDGEYTYAWDVRDRLTSVTDPATSQSWTFEYDALGRLVTMTEGAETVRLKWRGMALRKERIEASGTAAIERVYRADGIDQGGTHLALIRDVRGSVMGLATAGTRVRTYRYSAWGEQTVVTPGSGLAGYDTHMGFTGHVVHRPTGLVFAPARVYSPRLRQWLTRDPAGERDAVDGRNLYAYVAGDPVNRIDPTGLFWEELEHDAYNEQGWSWVGLPFSRIARAVDYFRPIEHEEAIGLARELLSRDAVGGDPRTATSELFTLRAEIGFPLSESRELVAADRYLTWAADGMPASAFIANLMSDMQKVILPRSAWASMDDRRPSLPNFWVSVYGFTGSFDGLGLVRDARAACGLRR